MNNQPKRMGIFELFVWCLFTWRLKPTVSENSQYLKDLGDKLLIVVFAYTQVKTRETVAVGYQNCGFRTLILPGISNEALAEKTYALWKQYPEAQFVIQWEVYNLLVRKDIAMARQTNIECVREYCMPGRYLDCKEIAEQANHRKLGLESRDHKIALVVTHEILVPRATALMENLGYRVYTPPGLKDIPYCRDSTQPWCRSKWHFIPREILARIMYRMKGWI